jgi:hypothetical protein
LGASLGVVALELGEGYHRRPQWCVIPYPGENEATKTAATHIRIFGGIVHAENCAYCWPDFGGQENDYQVNPDDYIDCSLGDAGEDGTCGFVYWCADADAADGSYAVALPGTVGYAADAASFITVRDQHEYVELLAVLTWDSKDPIGYNIKQYKTDAIIVSQWLPWNSQLTWGLTRVSPLAVKVWKGKVRRMGDYGIVAPASSPSVDSGTYTAPDTIVTFADVDQTAYLVWKWNAYDGLTILSDPQINYPAEQDGEGNVYGPIHRICKIGTRFIVVDVIQLGIAPLPVFTKATV